MPQYYGCETAKCPFYQAETTNTIKCEGDISQYSVQIFNGKEKKKAHKRTYCDREFKKCAHYMRIFKKYER